MGRLNRISPLGFGQVQGQDSMPASTFKAALSVLFVGNKVLQCGQQKGAEATPFRIGQTQSVFFEHACKEPLGVVLCCILLVPATPQVGINRKPIGATQGFQGLPALAVPWRSCRLYHTPVRCHEPAALGYRGFMIFHGGLSIAASAAQSNEENRARQQGRSGKQLHRRC